MARPIRFLILAGAVFVAPALVGTHASCTRAPKVEPAIVLTDAETQAAREFEARVADYSALHHKLEATIPPLPADATPEQIDQYQQAMGAMIQTARKDAKPGEFFTPGMEALVRRALGAMLGGPGGESLRATIMDDNPGLPEVSVNDRYPDSAPVTSMPVQLLETLPRLPTELEYRFLGRRMVLVYIPARIVLDLTPNVLP